MTGVVVGVVGGVVVPHPDAGEGVLGRRPTGASVDGTLTFGRLKNKH